MVDAIYLTATNDLVFQPSPQLTTYFGILSIPPRPPKSSPRNEILRDWDSSLIYTHILLMRSTYQTIVLYCFVRGTCPQVRHNTIR
jgi:hypothetical protein